MARKDLLKGLMGQTDNPKSTDDPPARVDTARPRYTKGAIGAVSKSIADLKSRAVVELDPHLIDAGGMQDRLEHDQTDHEKLMHSIRDHGQQVPVLVRPHPDTEERYQIVYGRRRVLALRDLGQPVKAMIRDLDDQALVIAQGQENTARKDLSFIEKSNFARQMADAGYKRKIICDALTIDKTAISRMMRVAETIPLDVIEHIGSAPTVGRDRWMVAADLWLDRDADVETAVDMINVGGSETSDARFEDLVNWLSDQKKISKTVSLKTDKTALKAADGTSFGSVTKGQGSVTIVLKSRPSKGFDDWLVDHLEDLHRDWLAKRGE
ncbi:plasmid partitioning protein RepB [Parasulfitobacter algicola]|uniref:Plasmid partitioning protein RepB n=1 Tax=Parasulfitobacter algicola TaxID=2614809 RepID=A0ABX2IXS2_9RHOB|nr:plasmid partitioning protein RepB [Sulfitobacter algicola]NSX56996.1 plasmid partitioning protein RepB [Sulfitobacter algicola]